MFILKENIGATRISYILHLADPKHNYNLLQKNPTTNGLPFDANNNSKSEDDSSGSKARNGFFEPKLRLEGGGDITGKPNTEHITVVPQMESERNVSKVIPNVFDDGIYEFIQSNAKSESKAPTTSTESSKSSDLKGNLSSGHGFNNDDSSKNISPESLLSWRERSNDPVQPTPVEQWRVKKQETDSVPVTSIPSNQASVPKPALPQSTFGQPHPAFTSTLAQALQTANNPTTANLPVPITESIVHNGAVLTGAGVKPCPTYELNNLYIKFPHLNPNKVANPLKPIPLAEVKRPVQQNTEIRRPMPQNTETRRPMPQNTEARRPKPPNTETRRSIPQNNEAKPQKTTGLQQLFDKVNKVNKNESKPFDMESLSKILQDHGFTLQQLAGGKAHSSSTDQINTAGRRMPERSSSSINLAGISKINGSNPQKVNRKSPNEQNSNNRQANNQNNRPNSRNANRANSNRKHNKALN